MIAKMIHLVFTVVLLFGGIRGNIDQGSPIPIKHVREVLPTSLLFLLNRRPTSGLGYKKIAPVPVSPIPLSPSAPVQPFAPPPPSIPAIPNAPISPSIPCSPEAPALPNFGIPPRSFYPTVRHGQTTQNSSPGQLSYDNPSNGNRKILNVVHIHLRPQPVAVPSQPPQPALPGKPIDTGNISTTPAKTDDKITKESKDIDESTNSFQFKPKDFSYEPVKNIEVSPIPVKPKSTEDVPSQATNLDNALPIAEPPKEGENPDSISSDGHNKAYQPAVSGKINTPDISSTEYNIESKDSKTEEPQNPLKDLILNGKQENPIDTGKISTTPAKIDDKITKDSKDSDESTNRIQFNPKDFSYEPVKNIEVSPISVKPKSTEDVPSQATNLDNALPIAEPPKEGENPDSISSDGHNKAYQPAVSGKINTPDISSTEYNIESKVSKTEEPQNPLKDLILNGNSQSKNADKELSDGEESETAEGNENEAVTENGNSSSKNDESKEEESEKAEDNLNKDNTENESTNDESSTEGTHSTSTNNESRTKSLPEKSNSGSTEDESKTTSSDNTYSQSTDSQSDSSATNSNTESSTGSSSEKTESSENGQNKSSTNQEEISSAGTEETQNQDEI